MSRDHYLKFTLFKNEYQEAHYKSVFNVFTSKPAVLIKVSFYVTVIFDRLTDFKMLFGLAFSVPQ